MRDIKFRAWNKEKERMHKIFDSETSTEWFLPNLSERFEVMQYTGLKDKNGQEVYEGDILYHPVQGKRKVYYPFAPHVAGYGLKNIENGMSSDLCNAQLYEIIGNIYENPDLLGG